MAVTVQTVRSATPDTHSEGVNVSVDETGHLHVRKPGSGGAWKVIAIYAPSTWSEAVVVTEPK